MADHLFTNGFVVAQANKPMIAQWYGIELAASILIGGEGRIKLVKVCRSWHYGSVEIDLYIYIGQYAIMMSHLKSNLGLRTTTLIASQQVEGEDQEK